MVVDDKGFFCLGAVSQWQIYLEKTPVSDAAQWRSAPLGIRPLVGHAITKGGCHGFLRSRNERPKLDNNLMFLVQKEQHSDFRSRIRKKETHQDLFMFRKSVRISIEELEDSRVTLVKFAN